MDVSVYWEQVVLAFVQAPEYKHAVQSTSPGALILELGCPKGDPGLKWTSPESSQDSQTDGGEAST